MIFLAAGHYPERPGAGFEGFFEHDEAVKWVRAIDDELGDMCTPVPDGTLRAKTDFINKRCKLNDVAIEIHFNSFVKDGVHVGDGCVTLYCPGSAAGMQLAASLQGALGAVFVPSRGIVAGWYRGDKAKGPYFFLERTRCPAAIIEPEFVHHGPLIQANRAAACAKLAAALREFKVSIEEIAT